MSTQHETQPAPAVEDPEAQKMFCKSCGMKATRVSNNEGVTVFWTHPGADHHVEPVPRDGYRICDFCYLPDPGWCIPLKEHADREYVGAQAVAVDNDALWAACDECAGHVLARRYGALRDRVFEGHERLNGRPVNELEKMSAIAALQAFWMAGPGDPVKEG